MASREALERRLAAEREILALVTDPKQREELERQFALLREQSSVDQESRTWDPRNTDS